MSTPPSTTVNPGDTNPPDAGGTMNTTNPSTTTGSAGGPPPDQGHTTRTTTTGESSGSGGSTSGSERSSNHSKRKGERPRRATRNYKEQVAFQHVRESKLNKEIQKLADRTDFLVPRAAMRRVVKFLSIRLDSSKRWTPDALDAIQESAEHYLTGLFEDSDLLTKHAKRKTLMPQDMKLVRHIRKEANALDPWKGENKSDIC